MSNLFPQSEFKQVGGQLESRTLVETMLRVNFRLSKHPCYFFLVKVGGRACPSEYTCGTLIPNPFMPLTDLATLLR